MGPYDRDTGRRMDVLSIWMIGIPWCIFACVAFLFLWKGTNPIVRRICVGSLATGVLMMVSGVVLLANGM
jgi:hypothetical protein